MLARMMVGSDTRGRPESRGTAAGRADRLLHLVFALLGFGGAVMVLVCTWRYGAGTSPEVAGHLAAARSLPASQGYLCPDGGLYTQPPLFPTLLAAPGLLGLDLLVGARLLNALAFGLIVYLSGTLFLRSTTSPAFAAIGTLAVLLSPPLLAVSVMVWPEPLLILLMLAFALAMAGFLHRRTWRLLILTSLFAMLAGLQMQAGIALIPAGILLIVFGMRGAPIPRRLLSLAGFTAIAVSGPFARFLRNATLTERLAVGNDWQRLVSLRPDQGLHVIGKVVAGWLFPEMPSASVGLIGVVALLVGASVAIVVGLRSRVEAGSDARRTQIASAVVTALLYLGFLLASGAELPWEVSQRVVAPLYVFVVLLVIVGIEDACTILSRRIGDGGLAGSIGLAVGVIWLLYPLSVVAGKVEHHVEQGAGGYSTPTWSQSPLLEWFAANPLEGAVYSNAPDAIYILTGRKVETAPRPEDFDAFRRRVSSSPAGHLVWSHSLRRNALYDLQEIVSRYEATELADFPDGAVYRLGAEDGPGASAVYRFWSRRTNRHYYTMSRAERDKLIDRYARAWVYEGPAFHVFAEPAPGTRPVHAFRSTTSEARFFTLSEAEKRSLQTDHRETWTYEGIAFHAWPDPQPRHSVPVYRLWSRPSAYHFYTAGGTERDRLLAEYPDQWIDEGVAWHAYKR